MGLWTVQRGSDSQSKAKAFRKGRSLPLEITEKFMCTLDEGSKALSIKFKDRHVNECGGNLTACFHAAKSSLRSQYFFAKKKFIFPYFTKPKISLQFSQDPATGPYPDTHEFGPRPPILFM